MRRTLLALVPLLLLAGCGGGGGGSSSKTFTVTTSASTVAPGGTAIVVLSQTGYAEGSTLEVVESGGGTLTDDGVDGPVNGLRRVYTAPSAAGTYHIDGTVFDSSGQAHTKQIAITVAPVISQ